MTHARSKTARFAVLTIFFVNGATIASWVPHIPLVQEKLGLSEGLLGLALLGVALGAVFSLTLSGWLIARFGSRLVTGVSTVAFCLSLPPLVLASSFTTLVLALIFFGLFNGAMDVAMNTQAVEVEKRYDKPIMSSFHGFFSLGGLFGAGVGGLILEGGVSPVVHTIGASLLFLTAGVFALRHLLPKREEVSSADGPAFVLPKGSLLGLGLLAFVVFVGEGAMADWSAVYLRNVLGTSTGLAAAGFAAFSLMMAVGRLTGDVVVGRLGPARTVRFGSLVAGAGLGLSLLIGQPLAAIVGFGCVGLGLANLVPVFFSAAGRTPGVAPGTGIAAVATLGYLGWLAGPPLIGFAAEVVTLAGALGLVAVALGLVMVFARLVRAGKGDPNPTPSNSEDKVLAEAEKTLR